MKLTILTIVFSGLFGGLVSGLERAAAADETPLKLSWKDAIQRAIAANAELQSSDAILNASRFDVGTARGGYLPLLQGSLGLSRASDSASGLTNSDNIFDASLTLTQNLFAGFLDTAKIAQAEARANVSQAKLVLTKARVSYELKSGYQGYLFAKANVDLSTGIVTRREHNLKMVQLRFEGGRENRGSVLLSEAYLEDAKLLLIQAKNGHDIALANLRKTLGLDSDQPLEITDEIPTLEPGAKDLDFRALAALTPVYGQAAAEEKAAREDIRIKQAGFYPFVNLTVGTSRSGAALGIQDQDANLNQRWSLGVSITIPLYNGGRDYYSTKGATESYLSAARLRENASRSVVAALEKAYSEYIEEVARFRTNRSFREALRVRSKIAKAKYNQGLLSFDDWDVIENDLIDRERNYLSSSRDRVVKEAAWEQTLGRGVIP